MQLDVSLDKERDFALYLRIPDWCEEHSITLNGNESHPTNASSGYLVLDRRWSDGDRIELNLHFKARHIRANTHVHDLAGKVAIAYGPLIYCIEEIDNGADLQELIIDAGSDIEMVSLVIKGEDSIALRLKGYRERSNETSLYTASETVRDSADIIAIPYYQWGNRDRDGEMKVWLREE